MLFFFILFFALIAHILFSPLALPLATQCPSSLNQYFPNMALFVPKVASIATSFTDNKRVDMTSRQKYASPRILPTVKTSMQKQQSEKKIFFFEIAISLEMSPLFTDSHDLRPLGPLSLRSCLPATSPAFPPCTPRPNARPPGWSPRPLALPSPLPTPPTIPLLPPQH